MSKTTLIALWGAHRQPNSLNDASRPSNVDKGVRELVRRGWPVRSIYPGALRQRLPVVSRLGRKGIYKTAIPWTVLNCWSSGGTIYTSSLDWARIVAQLKRQRIIRNRLIVRWAGIDTDLDALARSSPDAERDRVVVEQADVCVFASTLFHARLRQIFPHYASKFQFWPTGVDTAFYRERAQHVSPSFDFDIVAVGSDNKRDWDLPIGLSQHGVRVALLTEDKSVKARIDAMPASDTTNLFLHYDIGLEESASVMARSRCVLISTLPNLRFSGSTTVGVAAALGRPLLMDDPAEMAGYGLKDGYNCLSFERGNISAALAALTRILGDSGYQAALGHNITGIANGLDILEFSKALETCIDASMTRSDFVPSPDVGR